LAICKSSNPGAILFGINQIVNVHVNTSQGLSNRTVSKMVFHFSGVLKLSFADRVSYRFALRYTAQIAIDIKVVTKHLPISKFALISKVVRKVLNDISPI
jgi:hypothetical protein